MDNIDSSFVNQTVFLNSSSYKNMIATGNLTYVESKDLKWKLSNYYEAWNKRIELNGEQVDNTSEVLKQEDLTVYLYNVNSEEVSKLELNMVICSSNCAICFLVKLLCAELLITK